jgi:hypothetical protein
MRNAKVIRRLIASCQETHGDFLETAAVAQAIKAHFGDRVALPPPRSPASSAATRTMPTNVVCGDRCRQAVYNRNHRERHQRQPEQRSCATCGEPFIPKRSDAVHCSSPCRQKAYRARKSSPGTRHISAPVNLERFHWLRSADSW